MNKTNNNYKQTELGVIPNEWDVKELNEICQDITIGLVKTMTAHYVDNGVPLIRNSDIKENKIDKDSMIYLDEEFAAKNDDKRLKTGDIVTVHTGDIGTSAVIQKDLDGAHGFATLHTKVNRNIISEYYLCMFFNSYIFKKQAYAFSTGDGRNNLNLKDFVRTKICFPTNLLEQQKIANILSDVYKQIEQTDALIEKTKELRKGLMQRLLTKGIGHTEFRDTEIGPIPKEWKVKSVGQLFDVYGGMSIPRSKLSDKGALYLHYGDIHKRDANYIDTITDSDWLPRIDESEIKKAGTKLSNGDIVFADASEDYEGIGKSVVIFNHTEEVFYSGLHTIVAKSKTDELDNNYKRYCFRTEKVRSQFRAIASGATVFGISKIAIKDIKILVPPYEEQKKIAEILSAIDELILEYKNKSAELTSIKKSLMSKLLSGKIRVSY